MDFAELEYISRLRSGVKGHFSYRKVAWEMKQALDRVDPQLGSLRPSHAALGRGSVKEVSPATRSTCPTTRPRHVFPAGSCNFSRKPIVPTRKYLILPVSPFGTPTAFS